MTFQDVLTQAIDWLQRDKRVSHRALKRQFELDDDYIEDLKDAILYAHPQVVDDGQGLIWPGETRNTRVSSTFGLNTSNLINPRPGTIASRLHAPAPHRENPHLP